MVEKADSSCLALLKRCQIQQTIQQRPCSILIHIRLACIAVEYSIEHEPLVFVSFGSGRHKASFRERARLVFDRIFMLDKETCECLRYFVRYVPGPLTPRWKTFASPRTVELSTDLLAY